MFFSALKVFGSLSILLNSIKLGIFQTNCPINNNKNYGCHWIVFMSYFLANFVFLSVFVPLIFCISFVQISESINLNIFSPGNEVFPIHSRFFWSFFLEVRGI